MIWQFYALLDAHGDKSVTVGSSRILLAIFPTLHFSSLTEGGGFNGSWVLPPSLFSSYLTTFSGAVGSFLQLRETVVALKIQDCNMKELWGSWRTWKWWCSYQICVLRKIWWCWPWCLCSGVFCGARGFWWKVLHSHGLCMWKTVTTCTPCHLPFGEDGESTKSGKFPIFLNLCFSIFKTLK